MQRAHSASDIAVGHRACYADHVTEHGIAQADSGQSGSPGGRVMRLLVRPTPPPLWQGFIAAAALIGVETASSRCAQRAPRRRVPRISFDGRARGGMQLVNVE
jgi:hypothetical protein